MNQRITHKIQYLYRKFLSFPVLSFGVVQSEAGVNGKTRFRGAPIASVCFPVESFFYNKPCISSLLPSSAKVAEVFSWENVVQSGAEHFRMVLSQPHLLRCG